jgi:hypothetical protein
MLGSKNRTGKGLVAQDDLETARPLQNGPTLR